MDNQKKQDPPEVLSTPCCNAVFIFNAILFILILIVVHGRSQHPSSSSELAKPESTSPLLVGQQPESILPDNYVARVAVYIIIGVLWCAVWFIYYSFCCCYDVDVGDEHEEIIVDEEAALPSEPIDVICGDGHLNNNYIRNIPLPWKGWSREGSLVINASLEAPKIQEMRINGEGARPTEGGASALEPQPRTSRGRAEDGLAPPPYEEEYHQASTDLGEGARPTEGGASALEPQPRTSRGRAEDGLAPPPYEEEYHQAATDLGEGARPTEGGASALEPQPRTSRGRAEDGLAPPPYEEEYHQAATDLIEPIPRNTSCMVTVYYKEDLSLMLGKSTLIRDGGLWEQCAQKQLISPTDLRNGHWLLTPSNTDPVIVNRFLAHLVSYENSPPSLTIFIPVKLPADFVLQGDYTRPGDLGFDMIVKDDHVYYSSDLIDELDGGEADGAVGGVDYGILGGMDPGMDDLRAWKYDDEHADVEFTNHQTSGSHS